MSGSQHSRENLVKTAQLEKEFEFFNALAEAAMARAVTLFEYLSRPTIVSQFRDKFLGAGMGRFKGAKS
jgi:hypothetical protein